jgi:hypothetical protein
MSCGYERRAATVCDPTKPVPPVTSTRIALTRTVWLGAPA